MASGASLYSPLKLSICVGILTNYFTLSVAQSAFRSQFRIDSASGVGRFDNEQLNYRDVGLLGDCDSQCLEIAERLGWKEELDALVASVAGGAPANQTQDAAGDETV